MNIRNLPIKIVIFLLLLALPYLVRLIWFNGGSSYQAPTIVTKIDETLITAHTFDYNSFVDDPTIGNGFVIFDLSHANNLEINDLAPLRDRLEARGVTVETFTGDDETPLKTRLHHTSALIVLAPTESYLPEERQIIADFIEDGGRLLLAADPTRPIPAAEEEEGGFPDLFAAFFPASAIPAINSLAHEFGVVYFDDYLYNLDDNEGNYRNVKFTNFINEHPLNADLESVVLFAAHSLRSDGLTLVAGDEQTHSPVRSGETDLATVTLTADGRVLALGDVTFLTAPFHTIADNDRFMSHIADWLAIDTRDRHDLEDFPYLFKQPVNLIQVGGDFIDPRLIPQTSALQQTFDQIGLSLHLQAAPTPHHDALFIGTFDDLDLVKDYLSTAGITVTILITETDKTETTSTTDAQSEDEVTTDGETENTELASSEEITPSEEITSTHEAEQTPTAEDVSSETDDAFEETDQTTAGEDFGTANEDEDSLSETDQDEELTDDELESEEEGPRGIIEIETIGTISIEGTTLFIIDNSSDDLALIILAEDSTTAIDALNRLTTHDLSDCLRNASTTVCSTGEFQEGSTLNVDVESDEADENADINEDEEISNQTTSNSESRIFILADDVGSEGSRTGTVELEAILADIYDVTLWFTSLDDIPSADDLAGYDVYIIDSGDYAFDLDNPGALFSVLGNLEGAGVMLIGAQSFPSFEEVYEPITDLEVAEDSHPVTAGFNLGEIISLLDSESGVPSTVFSDDDLAAGFGPGEITVVLTRGPDSAEAGTAALIAAIDNTDDAIDRFIIANFAFYRLPEDIQTPLALNIVEWLLNSE